MARVPSRRTFLQSTVAATAALGVADLGFLSQLRPVSAAEVSLTPGRVPLPEDVAPLVKLIENTPREELLEVIAQRLHDGLAYHRLLAALLLAGVTNVEPRPSVGHKFHTVLVVNSAHLASLASPEEHRWLPIFWALDYFKAAAQDDVRERGDWHMAVVDDTRLPTAAKAEQQFIAALDAWDAEAADAAIVALARTASLHRVYEILFRYGARDFRSIGHKAIYVANSYRTLQVIGWRYAEPVLRSLTYALLADEGSDPRGGSAAPDQPGFKNAERLKSVRDDWQQGRVDSRATADMLLVLREANWEEACHQAARLLNDGVAPQSIWDALFVASAELLAREPGIVALHAVTTTNALHFAYQTAAADETRKFALLQNVAFVTLFRDALPKRESDVMDLLALATAEGAKPLAAGELLADLKPEDAGAVARTYDYLSAGGDFQELMDAARLLIFTKGTNAHDYKFSAAVLEDFNSISPDWRKQYLAGNVRMLRGASLPDNQLVARTRQALAT